MIKEVFKRSELLRTINSLPGRVTQSGCVVTRRVMEQITRPPPLNASVNHHCPGLCLHLVTPPKVTHTHAAVDRSAYSEHVLWKMLPFDCITCKRFQLCDLIQSRYCREVTLVSGISSTSADSYLDHSKCNPLWLRVTNPLVWSSTQLLEQS